MGEANELKKETNELLKKLIELNSNNYIIIGPKFGPNMILSKKYEAI